MALPADFSKIFGSTATGGLTPIGDVNYAKGWEFVGATPPTKNDFSYLQNLSDLKSQWLYSNKLQRTDPFGDIKADGPAAIAKALENLGLGDLGTASGRDVGNTQSLEIPDMSYFQLTGKGTDNLLAKLPNGLITQVFRRRLSNSTLIGIPTTIPVTYPTPFPTGVWGVFATKLTFAQIVTSCESVTNTGFDAVTCLTSGTSHDSNLSDVFFLAIGY